MFREVGMGCFKTFCMSESVLKVCWQSWVGCFVVFCCFLCVLCVCFVFEFFLGVLWLFFRKIENIKFINHQPAITRAALSD